MFFRLKASGWIKSKKMERGWSETLPQTKRACLFISRAVKTMSCISLKPSYPPQSTMPPANKTFLCNNNTALHVSHALIAEKQRKGRWFAFLQDRQKRNNLHQRHGSARFKFCFTSDPPKRFWWTIVQSLAQLGSRWRDSWEREKRLHRGSESNPITSDSSLNFTTEGVWWNLGTTVELHYHPA